MRTAIITKIKGLSIQTQQNTFVLFTLFKLTLDECKTLTKISTRKTSHNRSPNQRTPRTTKKQGENPSLKGKQQVTEKSCLQKRAVCIIGGESEALGFHQETTEESRKQQDWFCIKLYIIFVPNLLHFGLFGSRNVISTKTLFFFISRKLLQISVTKFKIQNIIFNASMKFKIQTLFSTQGNCCKFQLQNSKS